MMLEELRRFRKKPELLLLIGERMEVLNGCREAAGFPKLAKEGSVLLSVFTIDVNGLSVEIKALVKSRAKLIAPIIEICLFLLHTGKITHVPP